MWMVLSICRKDLLNERLFIGTEVNALLFASFMLLKNLEKVEFGLIFQ